MSLPFENDKKLLGLIDIILKLPCSSFIETGTYYGDSTEYIAENYNIPIYTCEINVDYYLSAKEKLERYPDIRIFNMSSEQFLDLIIREGNLGNLPLFFLDAHWYEYHPLADELRIISSLLESSVILVHDFKVPNHSYFGYDGRKDGYKEDIDINLIRRNIFKDKDYKALVPIYSVSNIPTSKLRGYIVIFQNIRELWEIIKKDDSIIKDFKEIEVKNK